MARALAFFALPLLMLLPGCLSGVVKEPPEVRVLGTAEGYLAQEDAIRLDVDTGNRMTWTLFQEERWHLTCLAKNLNEREDVDLRGRPDPITYLVSVTKARIPDHLKECDYAETTPTPVERESHRKEWVAFRADLGEAGAFYVTLETAEAPEAGAPALPRTLDPL